MAGTNSPVVDTTIYKVPGKRLFEKVWFVMLNTQ